MAMLIELRTTWSRCKALSGFFTKTHHFFQILVAALIPKKKKQTFSILVTFLIPNAIVYASNDPLDKGSSSAFP